MELSLKRVVYESTAYAFVNVTPKIVSIMACTHVIKKMLFATGLLLNI